MENQEQTQIQQIPDVTVTLQLNIAQVQVIIDALGKMATETNVWPLRQIINNQTVAQLEQLQQSGDQAATPSTSEEAPATIQ